MPFPFFPFFKKKKTPAPASTSHPVSTSHKEPVTSILQASDLVQRHFYNEKGFQTYASFFAHWDGYITAGHVLSEAREKLPPFVDGQVASWPENHNGVALDAAVIGCRLPRTCPADPVPGQSILCRGYPAGSQHAATRTAKVYMQRPGAPDTWIARIIEPDEPVVTGMSGGPVFDVRTGEPVGILITRNSPADLNNDRDPDESFDFISLAGVWRALNEGNIYV